MYTLMVSLSKQDVRNLYPNMSLRVWVKLVMMCYMYAISQITVVLIYPKHCVNSFYTFRAEKKDQAKTFDIIIP